MHFTVSKHLVITSDLSILETWKYCDYMQFDKTNLMNQKSLNSDHWLLRYFDLNCPILKNFINFDMYSTNFMTFPFLLILERWNLVIRFVLPRCNESNIFMSLKSTDGELFAFYCFYTFVYNIWSINSRDIKTLRLYAFYQNESNES